MGTFGDWGLGFGDLFMPKKGLISLLVVFNQVCQGLFGCLANNILN